MGPAHPLSWHVAFICKIEPELNPSLVRQHPSFNIDEWSDPSTIRIPRLMKGKGKSEQTFPTPGFDHVTTPAGHWMGEACHRLVHWRVTFPFRLHHFFSCGLGLLSRGFDQLSFSPPEEIRLAFCGSRATHPKALGLSSP